jgi:hypothetical protein
LSVMRGPGRVTCIFALLSFSTVADAQSALNGAPVPDISSFMRKVEEHQRRVEEIRESYTFNSSQTLQHMDADGKIVRTESEEREDFFVNGHPIERIVKRNGKPLDDHDRNKETERVTKLVEKAQKTPRFREQISIGRLLEIMDVSNERRENFRGRPTIVFDFSGRRDARTHGLAEDASKKVKGTIWIDEADLQVSHLEVAFIDNFHIMGGLFANIQKGSSFRFDQELVNGELWLPTGAEGSLQMRVLLMKNTRVRFVERDYNYKRFTVDAEQAKDVRTKATNP